MGDTPSSPRPALRWVLPVFLLIATTGFMALGIWQVERLGWKRDLIARVDARVHATPAPLPAASFWGGLQTKDAEYRRFTAQGQFLHSKEIPVYASTERGPGYWLMTPLRTDDGTVWVNRGYVDNAHRDRDSRARHDDSERVSVTGLLRLPEHAGLFLRDNVPSENRWYIRAPAEFPDTGEAAGPVAPFFLDAQDRIDNGHWPVAGMTRIQFRNSHLSYALTWFGMALLSALATIHVVRSELTRRR